MRHPFDALRPSHLFRRWAVERLDPVDSIQLVGTW